MPEPSATEKTGRDDEYDLDLDDPFNFPDGRATHLQQIAFTLKVVACMSLVTWYIGQGFAGATTNATNMIGTAFWSVISEFATVIEMMYNSAGMCPRMLAMRSFCLWTVYNGSSGHFTKFETQAELGGQDHIRNGGYVQTRQQDAVQNLGYVAIFFSGLFHVYPRRYGQRSFFGRYCCEAFPTARGTKLMIVFLIVDVNLARLINTSIIGMSQVRSAVFQSVIMPVLLFAWKRLYYIMSCCFLLDDATFKNNGYLHYLLLTKLLGANLSVALGGVSVAQISQCFSFLGADWMLFFLRMALLLRWGQKQCPKAFNALLDSALSSMLQPMPRASKAMGPSPAMRQNQAYTCLLEGIALSMSFLWYFFIAYVGNYLIAGDERMTLIFRAKSILPVLILTVADMFQDFLSNRATDKFSSWTALFLHFSSRTYHIMFVMCFIAIGSQHQFRHAIAALSINEAGGFAPTTAWSVGYSQVWSF